MSIARTVAAGVLILGAMETYAHADPLLTHSGSGSWTFWKSGAVTRLSYEPESSPEPRTSTPPPPPSPSAPPAPPAEATPAGTISGGGTSSGTADAFINLGDGPYPEADLLTTGGAQPWYTSPVVTKFFGGQQPDALQQADFANSVLQSVQQTYQQSGGLAPNLTLNPTVPANHTLSVVSGTTYGPNPNVIGIANVGDNGVSFIDKLDYAQTLDELEQAVAHNVSHELMHTFGVAGHNDTTGQYLDAATAGWSQMVDPNSTFSPETIQELRALNYSRDGSGRNRGQLIDGEFEILPQAVPEPATYVLWGLAAAFLLHRRRASK